MNVIILGAGAVGCYLGGRLAAAGVRVTLVGRPRTIEPLALSGLTITDLQGYKAHVDVALSVDKPDATSKHISIASSLKLAWTHYFDDKKTNDEATVILLCVKGGATLAAAQEIADCCPAGTTVVSLQNGVDNIARINSAAPRMQAIAGMVPYNVIMTSATHVHRATMGRLQIEQSAISTELVSMLNTAGLSAKVADDIRTVQWSKLLLNMNNPVNALSDLPLRDQLLNRDFRCVFAALQLEALAAMRAAKIEPIQLAAASPQAMPYLLKLPNWLFTRIAKKMLRMDANARSSMWDDVQHARTTEIDDMCGAVVRLASQVGTSAPSNAAMCKLIATHIKGHRWTGPELRKALKV